MFLLLPLLVLPKKKPILNIIKDKAKKLTIRPKKKNERRSSLAEELKEVFRNGSYERNVDEISESSMSPWSETFSPAIDSFPSSRVTTPDDSDLESLSGKRTETEGTIKTQALTSGRETMKLDVASEKGNNDKSIESYYEKIEKDLEVAEGQILYLDRENQSQLVTIKNKRKKLRN